MSSRLKTTLFLLTVLCTFLAGALGGIGGAEALVAGLCGFTHPWNPKDGILFCISIMSILFAHEMGHYLACRYYGIAATFPMFIPMPIGPFGTLGALIRIKQPIPHRRALFDIGAAGPLAGILVAIPFAVAGLHLSTVSKIPDKAMIFGDPLILQGLNRCVFGHIPPGYDVFVHPFALAAWVGFFVTALNLLPIGQLDGGHVIYSLFGRKSRYFFASVAGLVLGLVLGKALQANYVVFLVIILIIGFRHPPTIYDFVPLDAKRKLLAFVILLCFILCFTPQPIKIIGH